MAAILNSTMLDSDTLFSSLRFTPRHSHSTLTLTQTNSIWLNLIHSHLNLMMAAILDSATLVFPSQTHSHLPGLVPTIAQKKPSLIHSDSTWWWQPFWILPCWIKKLHSFILTQLDDGSHLEFCNVWLKNFTHSFWLNLMMAAIFNSAMLDSETSLIHSHSTWWWQPSWILSCGLRHCHLVFRHLVFFSQIHSKHPHSILTLTQTNSIWLKLIHSHSTWWWQPSWILPSWIWPSWIQPS